LRACVAGFAPTACKRVQQRVATHWTGSQAGLVPARL
jgi:hypothetical protein